MFELLVDGLFLFDEDLPIWNAIVKVDLENLREVLEFGRIFPISTPNDNHHRLLEDIEPMGCIEDPCCCFPQMDIMPGPILLDNHYHPASGFGCDEVEVPHRTSLDSDHQIAEVQAGL